MSTINMSAENRAHLFDAPTNTISGVPVPVYENVLDEEGKNISININNVKKIDEIISSAEKFPARTVRWAYIFKSLVEETATHYWAENTTAHMRNLIARVHSEPATLYQLSNKAKAFLAVEEAAQAKIDARLKAVYDDVSKTLAQYRTFGVSTGMDEATEIYSALLLKAFIKPEEWSRLSVEHTTASINSNPFWSPASDQATSITEVSKVIPKIMDYNAYVAKMGK